jgi:hypothetical protein
MKAAATAMLAGAALAGAPAFAADFTFDIPVVIENVPSATSAAISCYVSIVPPGGAYAAGGSNVVGRGETSITITGGTFRGTVTVEVNASGLHLPSAARSYNCSLSRVAGRALTGTTYTASSGNAREVYERATGLHLDRLVVQASGPLP